MPHHTKCLYRLAPRARVRSRHCNACGGEEGAASCIRARMPVCGYTHSLLQGTPAPPPFSPAPPPPEKNCPMVPSMRVQELLRGLTEDMGVASGCWQAQLARGGSDGSGGGGGRPFDDQWSDVEGEGDA